MGFPARFPGEMMGLTLKRGSGIIPQGRRSRLLNHHHVTRMVTGVRTDDRYDRIAGTRIPVATYGTCMTNCRTPRLMITCGWNTIVRTRTEFQAFFYRRTGRGPSTR